MERNGARLAPLACRPAGIQGDGLDGAAGYDYHLEQSWMQLDRLLLGTWGGHAAIEVFSPVLPAFLDACYVLVYALPFFVVGVVYKFRRRKQIDEVLTIYLLGLFLAYAQFPFWPSEPPRAVFPFELVPTVTAVRRFNLWLLGSYGIHTSVFPSAHVSGAFAAAAAVWRILPDIAWIRWSTLTYAILIAISTVYGRYHYAADAFAGMAVALAAFLLAEFLHRRRASMAFPVPSGRGGTNRALITVSIPKAPWREVAASTGSRTRGTSR